MSGSPAVAQGAKAEATCGLHQAVVYEVAPCASAGGGEAEACADFPQPRASRIRRCKEPFEFGGIDRLAVRIRDHDVPADAGPHARLGCCDQEAFPLRTQDLITFGRDNL